MNGRVSMYLRQRDQTASPGTAVPAKACDVRCRSLPLPQRLRESCRAPSEGYSRQYTDQGQYDTLDQCEVLSANTPDIPTGYRKADMILGTNVAIGNSDRAYDDLPEDDTDD